MYRKLYDAWLKEEEKSEIQSLPEDFFKNVSSYFKELRVEVRGLDEKSLRAKLKRQELEKAIWLTKCLIEKRLKKIVKSLFEEKKDIPQNNLTAEEKMIYEYLEKASKGLEETIKRILEGRILNTSFVEEKEKIILRFLKETPSIVGVNLKVYGPFKAEDVVSIPLKNIEGLVKHGIAKKISI